MLVKHIFWFTGRIKEDRLDSTAAHSAYFIIIAFLPFTVFLLTLLQLFDRGGGLSLPASFLQVLPAEVQMFLQGLLAESTPLSSILSVSVITFLWAASNSMVAVIKGLNHIYGIHERRNYLHLRVVSMGYLVLFAFALVMTALTRVFGSNLYAHFLAHSPNIISVILRFFKSTAGLVMLILFFCLLFHTLPRRRQQYQVKFRNNLIGAVFSAVGWIVYSAIFSVFVKNFSNFSVVYGSLATLIALMFWLYFCMYILFIGAEVAIWLEHSEIYADLAALYQKWKQRRSQKTARRAEKGSKEKKETIEKQRKKQIR